MMKKFLIFDFRFWIVVGLLFVGGNVLAQTKQPQVQTQTVMFNVESLKYHKPSCRWAKKCTVNCIKIDKKEAKEQGGVPCKVCGG